MKLTGLDPEDKRQEQVFPVSILLADHIPSHPFFHEHKSINLRC